MDKKATSFIQDYAVHKKHLDVRQCMVLAQKEAGKSFASQVREIYKLTRGDGKLAAEDYYYYRLYDDKNYPFAEKQRFLSEKVHQGMIEQCCDPHWWAAADDKFLAYTLLAGCGAPVPETRAIFTKTARSFGRVQRLGSDADVAGFLKSQGDYPLFAKPLAGIGSFGAYLIEGQSRDELQLYGGATLPIGDFIGQLDAEQGYLFQSVLRPHPDLRKFGAVVSTVRVIVIVEADQPRILHTVWKIPTGKNYADNFWRDGNLIAAVNSRTGTVERVVKGAGPWLQTISEHPDTNAPLIGTVLPDWQKLIDLCLNCAGIFSQIRYQSWDIAMCPEGPVIVEVNTGSAFNLSQLAKGEGFLTEQFCEFLSNCGYKLKSRH